MTPELAIVQTLWDQWRSQPPTVPPSGNRLFVRWVNLDPDGPGWDDWKLVGLVGDAGRIDWTDEDDSVSFLGGVITRDIKDGARHGVFRWEEVQVEWGLFHGDGPVEGRVTDWAKA